MTFDEWWEANEPSMPCDLRAIMTCELYTLKDWLRSRFDQGALPNLALSPLNLKTVQVIGMLDRALSELKTLALDADLDGSDTQTVKHHAEDCVGLGQRVLEILKAKKPDTTEPPSKDLRLDRINEYCRICQQHRTFFPSSDGHKIHYTCGACGTKQ